MYLWEQPSNQYVIYDFSAESLGHPLLSAYLNSIGTNFSHGANFATAGSTIRRQNTTLFQSGYSPFSLDVQTWQFTQFKSRSQFFYSQGKNYSFFIHDKTIVPYNLNSICSYIIAFSITHRRSFQRFDAKWRIFFQGTLHLWHWSEWSHSRIFPWDDNRRG